MGVVAVVIAGLHHLDVILCNGRLLGKLLLQEISHQRQVAVEKPADESEGKHVAALQNGLVVHAGVGQTLLDHRCQRTLDDVVGVDAHLAQIVLTLELCLLQVFRPERVGVDDNRSTGLGIAVLRLQCCGVHGHQHVALVARGVNLACPDVNLKT